MINGSLSNYTNEFLSRFTNYQLSILSSLEYVTDRTEDDVSRWEYLRNKGWLKMTDSERKEWMGTLIVEPTAVKGMYTHNDLNRVESAIENIVNTFRSYGYIVPDMVIKTDWTYKDTFWKPEMIRYYTNIETLRGMIHTYPDTPDAPRIGEKMSYQLANDIEKILIDLDYILGGLKRGWYYVGDIVAGEV